MKIKYSVPRHAILPLALPLLALAARPAQAAVLLFEGFETDGLGTRYLGTHGFSDGADDYFIRTDGVLGASGIPPYTGFGGQWYWAAEDVDGPLNPSGLALLDFINIDPQGFPAFTVSIAIGAGADNVFDRVDDFVLVQYRFDAGPWATALAFQNDGTQYNTMLRQDTDFDGIGDGAILGLALQSFTSAAIPVTGSLLHIRLNTLVNADREAVAFDNILVVGVPEPAAAALAVALAGALLVAVRRRFLPHRGG